ncbi:MAG TPA: class E sortase [Acidimicrobiales bacterium]|jgi:sortase A|nr:class E sortase [Acidimicrobiales bacterium]
MTTATDGFTGPDAVAPDDPLQYIPLPPPPKPAPQPLHAAWKPPLGPVRKTIREIGWNLITAGLLVLLFVAYQLWGTGFAEAASQAKLKKQFAAGAAATAPHPSSSGSSGSGDASTVGGASAAPALPGAPEGSAIAHMKIPKIGLDKYVVEGVADADLSEGPGHYPGTPLPGEPGNVAIAGHRTTYGAPFFNLNELSPGDKIYITNQTDQTFLYVVAQSEVVKPTDVAVIAPTSDNRLTLTTCNPRYEATTRLIVVATLETQPNPSPPSTVPPRHVIQTKANLGGGQRSAWPPTLVFAAIAIALWVGVRLWARHRRYWKWIPFLVGIPVCAVPLWFMFENVIKLLPNNL